jgi:putative ABC transport system permease protein
MTVRNLVRNRRRTVLTCVATTFALAALICAAAVVYSIDRGLDRYMNQINKWDISARFSGLEGMSALDRVKAVLGVDGAEPMLEFPARLVAGNVSTDVHVRAFESGTRLHGSFPSAGSPSTPGRGQILLNNTIAKELGVKRGSRVSLTTAIGTLPVEVAGTIEEPMGGVSYMDLGYLRSLAGQDVLNVVVAKVAPGHSQAAVAREVGKVPGVAQVDTRQQNKQLMDKLLGSLKPFMNLIFLLVLAIAFAVVLTTATVNALERTQEFATMRTLGSGMGRVTGLLSAETFGIGLICLVPGVLLGLGMQWLLITRLMSSSLVSVPFFFPDTALELWLPVFLLVTILAGVIPTRGIAHLDLARVTKERAG